MKALKTLFIGAALTAALAGCKKEEAAPPPVVATPAPEVAPVAPPPAPAPAEITVASVTFGNAVGPDMNVVTPATSFGAKDTIYAAVATKNASSSATLEGKWTYQDGQVVHDDTVTIAPTGDAVTDFHINSPKGFPSGKYQIEVLLNGKSATTLGFDIK
ncbi:MAG TPA: hypothetical protein VKM00_09315 [Luteimonas sp.]|nr:hypothetical protein [Luteimonas sp.]